jgi:hypothetical protein
MSETIKHFPRVTPQPWKLEVPRHLDLEEEFNPSDEPTQEFHITEPDDYMTELELEDEITGVWEAHNE